MPFDKIDDFLWYATVMVLFSILKRIISFLVHIKSVTEKNDHY